MFRKIGIMLLVSVLLIGHASISSTTLSAAQTSTNVISDEGKYLTEFIEENENYFKIKFKDKLTGQVEYLEWFKDDGNGNSIMVATDSYKNTTVITDEDISNSFELDKNISGVNTVSPFGVIPPGEGSGTWQPAGGWRYSKSFAYSTVSGLAGLLIGFLSSGLGAVGGAIVGSVTTMSSIMAGAGIKDVWFDADTYYNRNDTCELRDFIKAYRYSNYTGYIGSTDRTYRNCRW